MQLAARPWRSWNILQHFHGLGEEGVGVGVARAGHGHDGREAVEVSPPSERPLRNISAMDEIHNGTCSRCGRQSGDCTTAELGEWIVERGGRLTCSECAKRVDQDAGEAS
jgi:hypothetical protein